MCVCVTSEVDLSINCEVDEIESSMDVICETSHNIVLKLDYKHCCKEVSNLHLSIDQSLISLSLSL